MTHLIDYLRDRLKVVITTCIGLLGGIVLLACIVDRSHAHTWAEQNIPFFWSLFGFVAAAVIIGVARWFGQSGILTREDYYDK